MNSSQVSFSAAAKRQLARKTLALYPGLRPGNNPNNTRFRSTVRDRGYNLPEQRQQNPHGCDLLQAARDYATWAHKGEPLKYVRDVYITHPKAVSERMYTPRQKAVAFLHDTVENRVTEILGKYDSTKHDWETYIKDEKIVIAQTLAEIKTYFGNCRIFDVQDIIDDVDILTKRVTDHDYDVYIERLLTKGSDTAIMVKLADLEDNSLKNRNPPLTCQLDKDIKRLARYKKAMEKIRARRPDIVKEMRLRRAERFDVRSVPGGRTGSNSKHAKSRKRAWLQARNGNASQGQPTPRG